MEGPFVANDEVETRLEVLMGLARDNLDELRVQLTVLLQENISLKSQLENSQNDQLFQIDTLPDHEAHQRVDDDQDNGKNYDRRMFVLTNNDEDEAELSRDENIVVVKNTCFNCSGDHQLPDCKEPRDARRINQNRREFLASSVRSARYHVDDNQKFGQFQPGLPSPALRKALGLEDDQLPSYIYRMRLLGHPPGWLKAAEINHSGLGIYVQKDLKVPDANEEEGEIAEAADKVQYDFDRLPEWPGFNVEPPDSFRDETRQFNVPNIQREQSKKYLIEKLRPKGQKGYVRGKMQSVQATKKKASAGDDDDADDGQSSAKKLRLTVEGSDLDTSTGSALDMTSPLRLAREPEVISSDTGTPIVTLYSPFAELPDREKWTTNTTDHIFFENLPESTGKYENIRGILQKIRKTATQPNFEEIDDDADVEK